MNLRVLSAKSFFWYAGFPIKLGMTGIRFGNHQWTCDIATVVSLPRNDNGLFFTFENLRQLVCNDRQWLFPDGWAESKPPNCHSERECEIFDRRIQDSWAEIVEFVTMNCVWEILNLNLRLFYAKISVAIQVFSWTSLDSSHRSLHSLVQNDISIVSANP